MNKRTRVLLGLATAILAGTAQAVPTFGVKALGNDLEPERFSGTNGGPGATSAAVSFTTLDVEARYDALSTYLPVLRARSTGEDATFDDDRTNTEAAGYQVFTSAVAQTIVLDVVLDSVVTNLPAEPGLPAGTSGVLADVWVIGGPGFQVQDGFCSPGQFTFDRIYFCGQRLERANLFNGGDRPQLSDELSFTVGAVEQFGVYARLSAGSFRGTADAFDTLTLSFADDSAIAPVEIPSITPPTPTPTPASLWLVGLGLCAAGLRLSTRPDARNTR